MIYVKSMLAGIVAVVITFGIALIAVFMYVFSHMRASSETSIGWDPFPLLTSWTLTIPVAIFCAGFVWEFRRVRRRLNQ